VLIMNTSQQGVSMIELMVGLVIIGILLGIGAPALGVWIQNGKIRVTADAIQNGLQLARSEAVRRNSLVRFQLTSSIDNTCALSTNSSNWIVSFDDPTGACASTASETVAPRIIQARPASEGSVGTAVNANQSFIVFNGLGRQSGAALTVNITNTSGGTPLNVLVSTGGQIRMCDPSFTYPANPKGC
jgi:type IV fimbrial biogenesis protein FimT